VALSFFAEGGGAAITLHATMLVETHATSKKKSNNKGETIETPAMTKKDNDKECATGVGLLALLLARGSLDDESATAVVVSDGEESEDRCSRSQSDRSERSDPRGARRIDLPRGCGDASKKGASADLPSIDSGAFPVGSPPRTSAGAVEGTFQFVAPGQYRGNNEQIGRGDETTSQTTSGCLLTPFFVLSPLPTPATRPSEGECSCHSS